MDPTGALERRSAGRHGVITRVEARRAGMSDRQIRLRVDAGRWIRHSPHVFLIAGAPRTARQNLLAATARHTAAASHLHAAWLHGLCDQPTGKLHVARSSPRGSADRSVVVHRLADLRRNDTVTVDSIPATSATRTLLDAASLTTDAGFRSMVDRARRLGLTHPDALIARFVELAPHRRAGIARARRVLSSIHEDLAPVESELEALLLQAIFDAGLPAPVPQFVVDLGAVEYRLDLAYPSHRLAIEGDGFEFHSGHEQFEHDRQRQNDLVLAGWHVLRFTWRQIRDDPDRVVAQIRSALDALAPTASR